MPTSANGQVCLHFNVITCNSVIIMQLIGKFSFLYIWACLFRLLLLLVLPVHAQYEGSQFVGFTASVQQACPSTCAVNHPYEVVSGQDSTVCAVTCMTRFGCVGFNYNISSFQCQLFFDVPSEHAVQPGYSYYKLGWVPAVFVFFPICN